MKTKNQMKLVFKCDECGESTEVSSTDKTSRKYLEIEMMTHLSATGHVNMGISKEK